MIFQVADGQELRSLVQTPVRKRDVFTCSALHPNGRLLAVGMTNGVGFWDVDRDVSIASLPIGQTESLVFEPSGDLLTLGRVGAARWPVREGLDGSKSFTVGPPEFISTRPGREIDLSRDGRVVGFCQSGESPIVLDRDRPKELIRLGPQGDVRSIAISPSGQWAATGSHNHPDGVKVWSLPNGRFEKQFPNHRWPLFSPDGRWLVTHLSSQAAMWAVGEWREGPRFNGVALAFSPDSRLLVIAQPAGSVQLVETESGRVVATLEDPRQSHSNQATFSADSSRVILTSDDVRAAQVWDLGAIRRGLGAIGLDWEWPSFPEPDSTMSAPDALHVVTDLGDNDFALGEGHPQELDRLSEAIEIDPDDYFALARRSFVFSMLGRRDDALADCSRALSLRPGDYHVLNARAEIYLWKKQYDRVIADCEASLSARPDQASTRNVLAWSYLAAPAPLCDHTKALTHAREAVRLAPKVASHRNTLGIALFRAGQFREATVELETSLAATSRMNAPFDLFFLAMCHFQLGDTARAKVAFERARHLLDEVPVNGIHDEDIKAIRREAEAMFSRP